MIPRQPAPATEAQIQRFRELAKARGCNVEDLVCVASYYRTTSPDKLYKREASVFIQNNPMPCQV